MVLAGRVVPLKTRKSVGGVRSTPIEDGGGASKTAEVGGEAPNTIQ